MGGRGSGSAPDDGIAHGGGRAKKSAVAVVGIRVPLPPDCAPDAVVAVWQRIIDTLAGRVFEDDSDALWELAELTVENTEIRDELRPMNKEDDEYQNLKRVQLANHRAVRDLWAKFGMTPRDRQLLLMPGEEEELDPLEERLRNRG